MLMILLIAPMVLVVILVGVPLYGLPATLSLPAGIRPGLEPLTISHAAQQLARSRKSGWDLVEEARSLVAERMAYSRRNSFDNYERAFVRGYGYCGQHAFALEELLRQLGFEAEAVQAFQNRFPDGTVTSHAWVQVVIDGQIRDIDSLFYDGDTEEITFTPISEITHIPPILIVVMEWGAPAVNAHRYYLTGKDQDW